MYKVQLTLSCDVSVPQKLHDYVVPYTSIVWSTPLLQTPEGDRMQDEIYDNGTALTRNLTISSLNESHNGLYICQAIIQLPNSDEVISPEAIYDLQVEGD